MQLFIDFEKMTRVFARAAGEGRFQLLEHEAYELLYALGSESVPEYLFFGRGQRLTSDMLVNFLGEKVVIKVVCPDVVHKSDVGGVKVVPRMAGKVRSESRRMVDTVSGRFAQALGTEPEISHYRGLCGRELEEAVNRRILGVLITQYLPPDSDALGNELLVSLRWTREFGMVITAGLGGTDTELYAERFRLGQAVVSASTAHITGEAFFDLFCQTIAYQKLSGQTRGQERLLSDEQLVECFGAFIAAGNYFSPLNPDAPYVIEELEVNPFALVDYEMVPLDGLCRFSQPFKIPDPRGIDRIENLLKPASMAIMGASATKINFGRQILKNVLTSGFPKDRICLVSATARQIEGVGCVASLEQMPAVDLLVVAVDAGQVPGIIDEVIERDLAGSVILIPGGLGETKGSKDLAEGILNKIRAAHAREGGGPVFLGANCLGMISRPGKLDTFFAPDASAPKRPSLPPSPVALVSQSGGFALVRMTDLVAGDPAYNITVGNQMDLTIGDFISWLAPDPDIGIICVYAEGFQDLDGLHACTGIRDAVARGKEVIVYKAGRTPEGKKATSGHTASVAGDYMVCTSCLDQAGALVADSLEEFDGLMNLAAFLHGKKISGFRIGALSPAGFETVGIADSLESRDSHLVLPAFEEQTRQAISGLFDQAGLSEFMDIKNPLDVTPAAPDRVYTGSIEAMLADDNIDAVVMSLGSMAPATKDMPDPAVCEKYEAAEGGLVARLPELAAKAEKPLVVFNDAGRAHVPVNRCLEDSGVPVFASCGRVMSLLARYTAYRMRLNRMRLSLPVQPDREE